MNSCVKMSYVAAQGLVEQILQYGRIVRPVLGITIAPPQAVRQLGLEGGVLVLEALPGGPAAKAGIKSTFRDNSGRVILGDIIVGIEDSPVLLQKDLFEKLDDCKVGQMIRLKVLRNDNVVEVTIKLADQSLTDEKKFAAAD